MFVWFLGFFFSFPSFDSDDPACCCAGLQQGAVLSNVLAERARRCVCSLPAPRSKWCRSERFRAHLDRCRNQRWSPQRSRRWCSAWRAGVSVIGQTTPVMGSNKKQKKKKRRRKNVITIYHVTGFWLLKQHHDAVYFITENFKRLHSAWILYVFFPKLVFEQIPLICFSKFW